MYCTLNLQKTKIMKKFLIVIFLHLNHLNNFYKHYSEFLLLFGCIVEQYILKRRRVENGLFQWFRFLTTK
jgi:hypothetical protein